MNTMMYRLPGPVADLWQWQLDGSCRRENPDVFFHPEGERGPSRRNRDNAAKAVCLTCPVLQSCREHALRVHEPYGVWGGLTEHEREGMRVASAETAVICGQPGPHAGGQARSQATPGSRPARGKTAVAVDSRSGTLTTMEIQQQADQASADEFFVSVARLGASPASGATYNGTTSPVPLICVAGHACAATPSSVQRGQEICDTCASLGTVSA